MAEKDSTQTELRAEDVVIFLKENPDFLIENPKLLQSLTPPAVDKGAGVVDFQKFMLERLKNDKKSAVARQREIIEMSRSNMNTQARIHASVIRVLDAHSFDEFIETVTHEIGVILDVDIVTIVIETVDNTIPKIGLSGIRITEKGVIDYFLKGKDTSLQEECKGHESIFGGGSGLVHSQALLKLNISQISPKAMLAFGSRDPKAFVDGQATDLIRFLADVIERMFNYWLQSSAMAK